MGAPILNSDTNVGANDPTPKARQPMPVLKLLGKDRDVSPVRRGKHADSDTETLPRLPSQKYIDVAYLISKVGRITAFFFVIAPTCVIAMPWIGSNVVIPIITSLTRYVETQAEISKSLVVISQESVRITSASLEQNKKIEEKLDHFTARLDASIEVQKDILNKGSK